MAYFEEIENPKVELVEGAEVLMSPASTGHNRIAGNLFLIIGNYLRGKRCRVFYETKVIFDEKNHYIPDLIVVCDRKKIKENAVEGPPDLVVEILSPSTQKRDLGVKKRVYEKFGVKEYWIVNPKSKSVEVYHLLENRFELDSVCAVLQDWEWEAMTEKEKREISLNLKVSLYDDLVIDVREIFE